MLTTVIEFLDSLGPTWILVGLGTLLFLLYGLLYWACKDDLKELSDRLGYWEIRKKREK